MSIACRRSGRISFMLLAGVAAVIFVGLLFFFNRDSPASAASKFMSALTAGDAKTLAQYSTIGNKSEADVERAWADCLKYSKHIAFAWMITDSQGSGERATIKLQVAKASTATSATPEHFELELTQVNGKWKVDESSIARDMYPYLP